MRLLELFRPAVAQNPSMSKPVVEQLSVFEKRDAWPLARESAAEPPRRRRLAAVELLQLLTAARRVDAGKSQKVDHAKTLRRSVMGRQCRYPTGLHAKVRVRV